MSALRSSARRLIEGVGLGFALESRRAWRARRAGAPLPVDRPGAARRHLRGEGLEIGPLHRPIPLPPGVRSRFVDRFTRSENIERFPSVEPEAIVETDVVEDGFELRSVPAASQDFVVASHVLEHSPNPLQVLANWSRVTRPGGCLYTIVPIAESCFDAGRPETSLEHLIGDWRAYASGDREQVRERNRPHYVEWVEISERRIFEEAGHDFDPPTPEAVEMRVGELLDAEIEIHFHTFSAASFGKLLDYFCSDFGREPGADPRPGSRVVEFAASDAEVLGVVELG